MRSLVCRVSLIAFLAAAGCSGHGSTVSGPIPQTPAGPSAAQVQFRIVVPAAAAASASRRPRYVSASTKSAVISVAPGSVAAVTVNCTAICQGAIGAPIGTDTFTVKLYDGAGGTGNLLSTGTVSFNVLIDVNNTLNITFNGVVAAVAVTVNPSAATYGQAQTSSVTVNALDADGNIIVAPGVYVDASGTPVTIVLSNSDTSGHTVLSVTRVTQPTTGITLTYDGNSYVSPTITGTISGLPPANGNLTVNCRAAATTTALYTNGFSDTGVQTLDRYPLNVSGDGVPPAATASLAIDATAYASGLALDAAGTLYANGIIQTVANPATYVAAVQTWCADVTGSPPPRTTFIEPQNEDGELALDANANVYSTTFNSSNSTFSVFEMAANTGGPATSVGSAPTPTPTLESFVATAPVKYQLYPSISVDASGNIFAGLDSVVNEYAANPIGTNPAPTRSISALTGTGLITPLSTAVDPSGNVFVLYQNDQRTTFPGGYAVAQFAAAAPTTPVLVIEGPATQIGTYRGNPPGTVNSSAVAIAVDAHDNIFVLDRAENNTTSQLIGEGSVQEFTAGSNGNAAPATTVDLTGSAVVPNGLAVDASDNLYISDQGSFVSGGSWYEFTLGGTRVKTLAGNAPDGTSSYENIAVDSSGNVAVTDYDGSGNGNIYFFGSAQTGNAAPARTLAVSDVVFIAQLGFDASGNLYVLRSEYPFNTVFISPYLSAERARRVAAGRESARPRGTANAHPAAIRRSIAGGRTVRGSKKNPQFAEPPSLGGPSSPGPMISVYAPTASGNASPIRTFTDQFTFDSEGNGMAVSSTGVTYVSSRFGNAVYEYTAAASSANAAPAQAYWTFGPSTALPQIATDGSGLLYVVSGASNSISVFSPGSVTPTRTIYGSHTMLSAPGKPAIDAAGELFVLDYDLNAVLVFGPGQSGDAPPIRTLSQTNVAARQVGSIAIGPGTVAASSANKRTQRRH